MEKFIYKTRPDGLRILNLEKGLEPWKHNKKDEKKKKKLTNIDKN